MLGHVRQLCKRDLRRRLHSLKHFLVLRRSHYIVDRHALFHIEKVKISLLLRLKFLCLTWTPLGSPLHEQIPSNKHRKADNLISRDAHLNRKDAFIWLKGETLLAGGSATDSNFTLGMDLNHVQVFRTRVKVYLLQVGW